MWLQAARRVAPRRAVFWPLSPFRYGDVAEPRPPNARWLTVRNRLCGLCASDIHLILMDVSPGAFPVAVPGDRRTYLGHELVGQVTQAGGEVTEVSPGDRVVQRIEYPSCFQMEITPPCPQCAAGRYTLCENVGVRPLATQEAGAGFSPVMVMHRTQPFRIPASLADEQAVLMEPTSCAVHAVMRRSPRPGERVLVIGCGTLGLLTVAVAKRLQPQATIHAVARYRFQAEHAERMGADEVILSRAGLYEETARITGARLLEGPLGNRILLGGFDLIYDTIGSDRSLQDALRCARARGSVMIVGVNLKPRGFDYSPIWYQEVDVQGIFAHGTESTGETSFQVAARLLDGDRLRTKGMITHRFPVRDYRAAILAFTRKEKTHAVKIVLEHSA